MEESLFKRKQNTILELSMDAIACFLLFVNSLGMIRQHPTLTWTKERELECVCDVCVFGFVSISVVH